MNVQLRPADITKLSNIFSALPFVENVLIFGSRALGTARRDSDIDLAVTARGISESQWSELQEQLEKAAIIYPMDIVRLDQLPENAFKKKILSQGIVIYEKQETKTQYENKNK